MQIYRKLRSLVIVFFGSGTTLLAIVKIKFKTKWPIQDRNLLKNPMNSHNDRKSILKKVNGIFGFGCWIPMIFIHSTYFDLIGLQRWRRSLTDSILISSLCHHQEHLFAYLFYFSDFLQIFSRQWEILLATARNILNFVSKNAFL